MKTKSQIFRFILYVIYLFFRVSLRLIYGKDERDQLISVNHFPIYHKLKQKILSLRWSSAKYGNDNWEPKVSIFLKGIKGKLFVDIGASVGYYTLLLASNFDEIIAVEPETKSVEKLRKNTKHLKNVCILQEAISNEDGETTLYVSPTIGWHTITPQNKNLYEPIKIKTSTLDTILGKKTANLVKVDTEGAELKIIDGANPQKVDSWLIEEHGGENRKIELNTKLTKMGYETKWITPSHIFAYNNDITAEISKV